MRKVLVAAVMVLGFGSSGLFAGMAGASTTPATTCSTVTTVHKGTHLVFLWHREHGKKVHVWRREVRKVHGKRVVRLVPAKVRRVYLVRGATQVCVPVTSPASGTTAPAPTTTTTPAPPAPTVTYAAQVDPSFTQSATNPLDVAFSYSANATSTSGGIATNLAMTGSLPAGVLNFYSDGLLECSSNVGGSTTGGTCPVTYAATGQHTVVTEYVPNGVSAVSQTDTVTIGAYSTATAIAAGLIGSCSATHYPIQGFTYDSCTYAIGVSIVDSNGAVVTQSQGNISLQLSGTAADGTVFTATFAPTGQSACTVTAGEVLYSDPTMYWDNQSFLSSTNCGNGIGYSGGSHIVGGPNGNNVATWTAVASYAGSAGWTASSSTPTTIDA